MDAYIEKRLKEIKNAKTDKELANIIDEIYLDGENSGFYCAECYFGYYW